jgi:hypothetical protein
MKTYTKAIAFMFISHCLKLIAEYMYFRQCVGFFTSIFTWNSATCRGLRWISDSVTTNMITMIGGQVIQLLPSKEVIFF